MKYNYYIAFVHEDEEGKTHFGNCDMVLSTAITDGTTLDFIRKELAEGLHVNNVAIINFILLNKV